MGGAYACSKVMPYTLMRRRQLFVLYVHLGTHAEPSMKAYIKGPRVSVTWSDSMVSPWVLRFLLTPGYRERTCADVELLDHICK